MNKQTHSSVLDTTAAPDTSAPVVRERRRQAPAAPQGTGETSSSAAGPFWGLVLLIAVALAALGFWTVSSSRSVPDQAPTAEPAADGGQSAHDSRIDALLRGRADQTAVVPPLVNPSAEAMTGLGQTQASHDSGIVRLQQERDSGTATLAPPHDSGIIRLQQGRDGGTAALAPSASGGCHLPADGQVRPC